MQGIKYPLTKNWLLRKLGVNSRLPYMVAIALCKEIQLFPSSVIKKHILCCANAIFLSGFEALK